MSARNIINFRSSKFIFMISDFKIFPIMFLRSSFQPHFKIKIIPIDMGQISYKFQSNINTETTFMILDDQFCFNVDSVSI